VPDGVRVALRPAQNARMKWAAIAILAAAQFVMVLDSSVMNVSISQIASDLGTTIQGVQLAITAYTLVMAAFMLVGAKLGDIWGRDRAFTIGLIVYGLGSGITAVSPNLSVLLFGWSLVEGLGAVLVVPAIAALIAANYEGRERAFAYALIGGVAAAAVAAGPLIGGWVTTNFTWRLVFAGEVVIVVVILVFRGRMRPAPRAARTPRLDVVGAALSASGLALIVLAILQSSTWGWVVPKDPPTIGGVTLTPFGFSPVLFFILIGLGLLYALDSWEDRRQRRGEDGLYDPAMLQIRTLRAGLVTLGVQQLVLMGTFFVLPVYLQTVLGLNAFETGLRLFPLSVAMFIAALLGPRLAVRRSPRRVVQSGLLGLSIGAFLLLGAVDVELRAPALSIALIVFGIGAGLLASQLGNIILSSVGPERSSEAGGLQGTAQNLGASLGTALIGAILLGALSSGFVSRLAENPDISPEARDAVVVAAGSQGVGLISATDAEALLVDAGVPPADAALIADDYATAQLDALRLALLAVALIALGAFFTAKRLPTREILQADSSPPEGVVAAGGEAPA
jgi:EmrB/QacA subfamily drug resistance transporter